DRFDVATGLNVLSFDETIDPSFGPGNVAGDLAGLVFRTGNRRASMALSRLSVTARNAAGDLLPVTIGADLHVEVVPEPASLGLLGIGAAALLTRRRR
ncbi:MAG: PEP-CTERM sorting domain-containing protein, partial [Phycisphaerae bacterium]